MKTILMISALLACGASAQSPQPPALPFSQTISISHFGAKGDSVSDDSSSFAAGLAAAAKAGAELTLEDKTYVLKDTLRIPQSSKPIGISGGAQTILLFAPDHPLDTGIVMSGVSAVELKHFVLRGSAAGLHTAITIGSSSNIRLQNLAIQDIHGAGSLALSAILLAQANHIWITDSTVSSVGSGLGKPAAGIWNYYGKRSDSIYISHNHFLNNTASIVVGLFDTDNSEVTDNVIDAGNTCVNPCINNGYGILFYRTTGPGSPTDKSGASWPYLRNEIVTGNQIVNTAGSAIYLQGVHTATVAKNTINNTALRMDPVSLPAAGIALNWTTNTSITDNTIEGSGHCGIELATTQAVVVQRNQIHNSAKAGIRLRVSQVGTTITNNTIDGAPVGVLSEHQPVNSMNKDNVLKNVRQPKIDR
jgi:hypothetical protein